MIPRIEQLLPTKLIGHSVIMTFATNRTAELWRGFMPRRKEIKNNLSTALFSVQVYRPDFNFQTVDPDIAFEKWAAVEVPDFNEIPEGMKTLTLSGGLYAVFHYIGSSSEGEKVFRYIFGEWLPNSDYVLDQREHFEILGEKYKNNDPTSEEEIWIPVKRKK